MWSLCVVSSKKHRRAKLVVMDSVLTESQFFTSLTDLRKMGYYNESWMNRAFTDRQAIESNIRKQSCLILIMSQYNT